MIDYESSSSSSLHDFLPSTVEHRPLHLPEKMALKQYFEVSGADEYEDFQPSAFATTVELADFEAWTYGLRFWGRECWVRAAIGVTQLLGEAWNAALIRGEGDQVSAAAAYSEILTPEEAVNAAVHWGNIPNEEKAIRTMGMCKPLPEAWFAQPQLQILQVKPFIFAAFAADALLQSVLIKRDPAAALIAQACCGAVRVRMQAGRSPADAVADIRKCMILALRKWMGYKW